MSEYNFGLIPSPPDERDYLLSNTPAMLEIKRIPKELPVPFDFPVTNQGSRPSCVGHAGGLIKQYMELKEKEFIRPDREWLYDECKKIDGIPDFPGTYFRAVLKVLRDTGCKLEGQDNDPSVYRIAEYRKIDDLSFAGQKKALGLYGHSLVGYRGSSPGWAGEVIRPPRAGESLWSHAVTQFGYLEDYIMGQNSWGDARHNNGIFKAPPTYEPFEGWVITIDKRNEPREARRYGWVAAVKWTGDIAVYVGTDNVVRVNGLRVREKPGLSHKIIVSLAKGTQLRPAIGPDASVLDNFMEDKGVDGYQWRCIIL